ncbi:MAG: polyketide cyclase/dehydrase [Betaproteobacteria bacterium]|nr:polyketide cyclase/dehydrase [Betaproteobacteria bacterium]
MSLPADPPDRPPADPAAIAGAPAAVPDAVPVAAPPDWGNAPPPAAPAAALEAAESASQGTAAGSATDGSAYSWPLLSGVVLGGALYGLAMRFAFDMTPFKSPVLMHATGGMLISFLFFVPIVIGIITVVLAPRRPVSGTYAFFGPWVPMSLFCFGASMLMLEGLICIVIIAPIFMVMSSIGGLVGRSIQRTNPRLGRRGLPALMALPLLGGYIEKDYVPQDRWSRVERAMEIGAPPARVWQLINHPTNISPAEMAGGLAYRIGVPYPIEANTLSEQVGGLRKLVWQKGVHFDENITAIEAQKRICWTYHFARDSFPHEALDDHVVIGGYYFDLGQTCYTLMPVAAGTRLAVSVEYRVSTNFNWYAGAWGRLMVSNTAETILNFYRVRGGRPAAVAAATPAGPPAQAIVGK